MSPATVWDLDLTHKVMVINFKRVTLNKKECRLIEKQKKVQKVSHFLPCVCVAIGQPKMYKKRQ